MSEPMNFPVVREAPIGAATVQSVDARELHAALEVGRDFSTWIKRRIETLGFEADVDYVRYENLISPERASDRSPKRVSDRGGQNRQEYALTLNAAKHMAMVEKNATGKRVRDYFIEREREAVEGRLVGGAQLAGLMEQVERLEGIVARLAAERATPALPEPTKLAKGEGWALLRHLLRSEIEGTPLRVMLTRIIDNPNFIPLYNAKLIAVGIMYDRCEPKRPGEWAELRSGVILCPRLPEFQRLVKHTVWADGQRLRRALLLLPGAEEREDLFDGIYIDAHMLRDRKAKE